MGTILIVGNQTLPSEELAAEISKRIAAGARLFHVVVPATPPPGGGFTWDEEESRRQAGERLEAFLGRLRSHDVEAGGEVGDRDPIAAVHDAIRGREVDEVILSTLPAGMSRWLRQDVPSRLSGAVSMPVVVVIEREKAKSAG